MSDLEIVREFDATPEEVWRALTEPVELGAWFWPFTMSAEFEPWAGGRFRLAAPEPSMGVTGTVRSAGAHSYETSWKWDGEEHETRVGVAVSPAGAGARVRVTHRGFPDDKTRDEHVQGWQDCLDRLPGHLARR